MSEPREIYLLLVSYQMGRGATMAHPFHTMTQRPRASSPECGSIKCLGGLLTFYIHLAMSTDQQLAGQTGGIRRAQEEPLMAGPTFSQT